MVTRCSPEPVIRIAALGSSRTISTNLRAGRVIAPSWSTEAATVVPQAVPGRLHQDVGQDRQRRLARHTGRHGDEAFLELLPGDRELHGGSLLAVRCSLFAVRYSLPAGRSKSEKRIANSA
jgi:hypothetical protein